MLVVTHRTHEGSLRLVFVAQISDDSELGDSEVVK